MLSRSRLASPAHYADALQRPRVIGCGQFHRSFRCLLSSDATSNSFANRIRRGVLVISGFAAVQMVAQGLGLVTGFILVHALDKPDYALYTLTITGINSLVILTNGGILEALMAIGGRVWQDPHHMGQVVASAMRFRRHLARMVAPPILVLLAWFLLRSGAHPAEIAVLSMLALLAAQLQLSSSIVTAVLRLRGEIRRLQHLDLVSAFLRLTLTACCFFLLNGELAIAIGGLATAASYLMARRWIGATVDWIASPGAQILAEMRSVVRRQWFNDVAFICQGQLTLLLLGFFGGSESVANFGALGRIAALFGIFGAVMQSVILPRYARCQDPRDMRNLYMAILALSGAVAAGPVLAALLFPGPLLWMLGAQYKNLPNELVLVALNAGVASIAFTTWGLNSFRAWIIPPWINVPAFLISQFVLMTLIGVKTMEQVIWVGIAWYGLASLINIGATVIFSGGFGRHRADNFPFTRNGSPAAIEAADRSGHPQ